MVRLPGSERTDDEVTISSITTIVRTDLCSTRRSPGGRWCPRRQGSTHLAPSFVSITKLAGVVVVPVKEMLSPSSFVG